MKMFVNVLRCVCIALLYGSIAGLLFSAVTFDVMGVFGFMLCIWFSRLMLRPAPLRKNDLHTLALGKKLHLGQ